MSSPILLFLGTPEDQSYVAQLKPMVGTATVYTLFKDQVLTLAEIILYCKKRNITGVLTTHPDILKKLVAYLGTDSKGSSKKVPSIANYAGSFITYDGIEFVILNPLKQLSTISYGKFLARRYISKLVHPANWLQTPEFKWELLTPTNIESVYETYQNAFAIAVDIETFQENLVIRCIGYTAIFISNTGTISSHTCVLPLDTEFALVWMRKFNWLPIPKILQNGKYDCNYLMRYNAPLHSYYWDLINMMHCWYSELPKDLGFNYAFLVRRSMYWKDLSDTQDLQEYYRYNALDTYGTACAFLVWILTAPDWAKKNYVQEFPLVFPCMLSELTGFKRDIPRMAQQREKYDAIIEKETISLSKMVGTYPQIFNTNSTPQNVALRKILGCADITSSDESHLKKIASRHPINRKIAEKIITIREMRKLVSTYLGEKELNGRILYSLNPHGTDTGRLASREHHFWCGLQVQNIPRGEEVKCTIIADEGFKFAEVDLEQAESRDTAYISGDSNLINAVSGIRDFHSVNASAFFGKSYESIYSDELGKTLDKALRDLAKRVNHGANYLMGPDMLVDTMGEDNIWNARKLLMLPRNWAARKVAEYLLTQFHKTYPQLSGVFYPAVVSEVTTTSMLRSKTFHHTAFIAGYYEIDNSIREDQLYGWTRYCFGNPKDNKRDKNSLVAHVPQNLNAMTLNKAFMRIFYDIAINPKYASHFKLCAQIHDSILFQFREGHEYLCDMVRERMEIPVTVKGYDGITRTFTVPAAIKAGKDGKGASRWSETE